MIVMFIANEKMIFFRHFVSCRKLKITHQSMYIIFITYSIFRITRESSMSMDISRNSLSRKLLHFKNNQRRNNIFIHINTFHHWHSFLTFKFCLKLLTNLSIDNISLYLLLVDNKPIFIHVIHIFQLDIVFNNNFFQIIKSSLQSFK